MTETAITLPVPLNRKLYLSGDVDFESMNEISKSILDINDSDEELKKLYKVYDLDYSPKPIEIMIDTYGGMVYQCFGLIGIMEKSKTKIHTIATGAAMSCGFIILIHGHKRFAYEHATPMYHQTLGGAWGEVQTMEESIEVSKGVQKKWEEMTLDKTKISQAKLKEVKKTKFNWYMTAKEALDLGVVDEIM